MNCPACGSILSSSQIRKTNVRGFDKVDVVYDAICPVCHEKMGRMFWGEWLPNEKWAGAFAPLWANAPGPQPPDAPPKSAKAPSPESESPAAPPAPVHLCPHCGQALPQDLGQLPVQPAHPEDRRQRERRQGERRQSQVLRPVPDRRLGERRQGERRQAAEAHEAPAPRDRRNDRRKENRPVLYNRRRTGRDRRWKSQPEGISRRI